MAEVPNLAPAIPEIFLGVSAMVLLMLGVFNSTTGNNGVLKASRMSSGLGVVMLVLSLALVITVSGEKLITFDGMFVSDPFATYAKALILLASTFSVILAQDWMEKQGCQRFEYIIIILFATLGMMMMVSANSLISLYLGLELQSLSLYILAAYQRDELRSTEAGLKYFVLGALAS
ncbi:MAG: proton-conducting transporter membrane subunit, partial [Rhodospirillaceae bacterium]|nr:proton-conducting transporter membrane subunit [Rhodospirillaceae bacterium]